MGHHPGPRKIHGYLLTKASVALLLTPGLGLALPECGQWRSRKLGCCSDRLNDILWQQRPLTSPLSILEASLGTGTTSGGVYIRTDAEFNDDILWQKTPLTSAEIILNSSYGIIQLWL